MNHEKPAISPEEGISVSIEDRYLALAGLAKAYAQFAQAKGLEQASELPKHRKGIVKRYGQRTSEVVNKAVKKGEQALRNAEREEFMPVLTKSTELEEAGFDPREVETMALTTTIHVRHAIGDRVGAKRRNEVLGKIHRTSEKDEKLLES